MTTENARIVAIEGTSSGKRYICQLDTGFPLASRPTFALEIPPWVQATLKIGDVMPVSLAASLVEAAGGGAATSGITVYTFAPGGVADPANQIYTTWSTLMTAHNGDAGQRAIYFDNTAGSIVITAGTHTFNNRTRLLPKPGRPTPMAITLTTGAVLSQPYYISPQLNFQA
jgi:hypothetical protein